ncbi:MAG: EAL and HDOD domain-containing protein [Terriglobia bacterium]
MTDFVARQPIFTNKELVYGYELLFRSSLANTFDAIDGEGASRAVADHLMTLGKTLTDGKFAFINCPANFLVKDYAMLLPQKNTVIEVLETVEPTPEVISACRRLKQAGYLIALDDFVLSPASLPFIELADIIKIDFLASPPAAREQSVREFAPRGIQLLAEKIETREDFRHADGLGYKYFQGDFFCRPEVIASKRIPASKLSYLRVLNLISRQELDLVALEGVISSEVSLCYKLLHYMNSSLFGFWSEIRSVRHALALLGQNEVRKLVSVAAAISIAEDKPPELIATALLRAKFCEQVAAHMDQEHFKAFGSLPFIVGMFSVIDAMLGRSMPDILGQLALPAEAKAALLGHENALRDVFELVYAYEMGNWGALNWYAAKLHVDETLMPILYFDSLEWSKLVFNVSAAPKEPQKADGEPVRAAV